MHTTNQTMKMAITGSEDDDAKGLILNNPLRIQILPDKTLIDFYLPLEIDIDSKEYIDFFRALRDARPNDEVTVHINCYGGEVSTAFQIIDNLQNTQATVHISVEGNCCSAATLIALAGDDWDIYPHSYFMCHAYSCLRWGKKQEIDSQHEFDKKWLEKNIRDIYKGFLTPEELDRMMRGEDFYFDASEVVERLNSYKKTDFDRQEVVNKIVEKHQKLINEDLEKALKDFDDKHSEKSAKKTRAKPKKSTEGE